MKICLRIYVIVVSFCLLPCAFGQGALTPPGPPGPTMLTLSQLEPRSPVDATHTPGTTTVQFVISSPGSYYLTTNVIGASGKDGIEIETNNVTLDLNGFSVIGGTNCSIGIFVSAGGNIAIRNGIVSGWTNGIISVGNNVTMQGLTVSGNGLFGIVVQGANSLVSGNNVTGNNTLNGGGVGIYVTSGASSTLVQNNHVVSTIGGTGAIGIYAGGTGTIVVQNFVQGNGVNDIAVQSGGAEIMGQNINTTSSEVITNANPWGNLDF